VSDLLTIVEMPSFVRDAEKIWTQSELAALINHIATYPEAGDLIPDTSGLRKLRWGRGQQGKRGGARVVYYFYRKDVPVFMIAAYAKADQSDLKPYQKRDAREFALAVKEKYKL
jgi:hypothetical protein